MKRERKEKRAGWGIVLFGSNGRCMNKREFVLPLLCGSEIFGGEESVAFTCGTSGAGKESSPISHGVWIVALQFAEIGGVFFNSSFFFFFFSFLLFFSPSRSLKFHSCLGTLIYILQWCRKSYDFM